MARKRQSEKMSTSDAIAIATGKKTLDEVQGIPTPDFTLEDDSLELDFDAATKPKKNRARATRSPETTKGAAAPVPALPQSTGDNNIYIYDDENNNIDSINNPDRLISNENDIDIKAALTLKELNFLELYLAGGLTIDNAMIKAGYGDFTQNWRYQLARKIVIKYESQTEDKRNIFRLIGFGETQVAKNILNLAEKARSEMVRLNANALAAKCLRLTDEPERSHQGVNIIINCNPEPGTGGPGAPARPVQVIVQDSTLPPKPLQITK